MGHEVGVAAEGEHVGSVNNRVRILSPPTSVAKGERKLYLPQDLGGDYVS